MWNLILALVASAAMVLLGISALIRPAEFGSLIGLRADKPLGTSEIRAAFGGMFIAFGVAAIVLREPSVFAVLGAAWLADFAIRIVSVFVDRVSAKDALLFLVLSLVLGGLFLSGYVLVQ
jgi:hypothetical protein